MSEEVDPVFEVYAASCADLGPCPGCGAEWRSEPGGHVREHKDDCPFAPTPEPPNE